MTETRLQIPVSESDARRLKVGDIVHLSGVLHTMRDMGHRRLIDMTKRGEKPPFELREGAIWHCGPITRKIGDKWEIVAAGPTSSSRFTELGAEVVKQFQVRITVGKGNMGPAMVGALKETGGVYLLATGGCAAIYAKQVVEVENVHWLDLGMPEAIWVLRVNNLGPLVVGIDSQGNALAKMVGDRVRTRIENICKEENIDPRRTYVWWPKKVAGTSESLT